MLDSNSPCVDGPNAAYVGYRITNTSGGTLTGVQATLGAAAAGFGLTGGQVATQYVGTLAAGASKAVYWYVTYPCTIGSSSDFTVTVSDDNPGTVSRTDNMSVSRAISANAGGLLSSITLGPNAVLGQIITDDVVYSFGNTGSSDEFVIQPAGDPTFAAGCFQLIGVEIVSSAVNAIPAGTRDFLHFQATSNQGGSKHLVTVRYSFKYRCTGVSATPRAWAAQTSGQAFKYTGNYDDFPSFQPFPSTKYPL